MSPDKTKNLFKAFTNLWSGDLGLHAHDNLGLAMTNTLSAVEGGANWIDSTFSGMGRGPGNLKTEDIRLLQMMETFDINNIVPLWDFLREEMDPLLEQYRWGCNPMYFYSAANTIHPMYVQTILESKNQTSRDCFETLEKLRDYPSQKFSLQTLDDIDNVEWVSKESGNFKFSLEEKFRSIIIVSNFHSLKEELPFLGEYKRKTNSLVVAINAKFGPYTDIIDYNCIVSPARLKSLSNEINTNSPEFLLKCVVPIQFASVLGVDFDGPNKPHDFAVSFHPNSFQIIDESHCVLSEPLGIAYALAIAINAQPNRIVFLGFSGDGMSVERINNEINLVLKISHQFSHIAFESASTTFLPVKNRSFFDAISVNGNA